MTDEEEFPGWHIHIWVPDIPETEADTLMEAIADTAYSLSETKDWDVFIVAKHEKATNDR